MSTSIKSGCSTAPISMANGNSPKERWKEVSPSIKETWKNIAPLPISMAAGALAIVPVYYGFAGKTALQLGGNLPKMGIREAMKGGIGLAPLGGCIVGAQMTTQKVIEYVMTDWMHLQNKDNGAAMLVSSATVGGITSPILTVFNGKTMGQTAMQSLKNLNRWQVGAITARETSFVLSLRIADPVSRYMKEVFGDKPWVETASAFTSGAIGSVIGHPADTALTLWQKNRAIGCPSALMRGGMVKAVTIGVLATCYSASKKGLERLNQAMVS